MSISKWGALVVLGLGLLLSGPVAAGSGQTPKADKASVSAEAPEVTVYRSPTCGCCGKWIEHLEENGFRVDSRIVQDVGPIKRKAGLPPELGSCHTAFVEGYVIEGHVPAADVKRLLAERPEIAGLAVPEMPIGSPGMEGPNPERYEVIAFDAENQKKVFATHGP